LAGGLGSPDVATVVDGRDGEPVLTDGPFLESKEYIVGFWIIDAPNLDVALGLAALGSKHYNRRAGTFILTSALRETNRTVAEKVPGAIHA
jgi:hypothetical protein